MLDRPIAASPSLDAAVRAGPAKPDMLTLDLLDAMNRPLMDPEQYLIADEECVLDVSKGKRQLGWVPQYRDEDMLIAAYSEYRAKKEGRAAASAAFAQPAE